MKYLKKYQTRAEYEIAKNSLIRPNISYIVQENSVAFMPNETAIEVTFDVVENIKDSNEQTYLIPIMFSGETFCNEEPQELVQDTKNGERKYNFLNNNNGTKSNAQCVRIYPAEWFEKIEVDGVVLPDVVTTIEVEGGTHIIRYILKKDAGKDVFETLGYAPDFIEKYAGKTVPPYFLIGTQIRGSGLNSTTTNIKFSDDIIGIGDGAFSDCQNFNHIDISNIIYIRQYAFESCSALTSVTFSKDIEYIGGNAFANCSQLQSVEFPVTLGKDWEDFGGYMFYNCQNLSHVLLPKGLDDISEGMFQNCYSLYEITLSENVNSINDYAFGNTNLSFISIPSNNSIYISDYAFSNISQDIILDLQSEARYGWIGKNAFDGSNSVRIHVPDGSVNDFATSGNGWEVYYIYSDNGDYYDPNEQEEK